MPIPPQPEKPLKPKDIVARRPAAAPRAPVSAFSSSFGGPALSTVAAPPKPVFTILSWNVQKFENTKSLANPYVNGIINRILAELDADVCLLLEARENNSVNLSAIEHQLANPSGHKDDETTEAEWDLQELEDERAEVLKNSEVTAALGMTYQMLSTELTGKRYKPVKRIYLYGNPDKNPFFPKMAKQYSIDPASKKKPVYNGAWKRLFAASVALRDYYAPYYISTRQPIADIATVPLTAQAEADVVFRLKSCPVCNFRLGTDVDCAACIDFNPYSTASENLRNEIKSCAFSLGGVDLESYAVLARPHEIHSHGDAIQMKDKAAQVSRVGCRLLRTKPPSPLPYTLKDRRDAYLLGQGVPPSASVDEMMAVMKADLERRGINPHELSEGANLDAIGVPKRITPAPVPLSEEYRQKLFLDALQPGTNPNAALDAMVTAAGVNPAGLAMAYKLTVAGVPTATPQLERDATRAERLQQHSTHYPGRTLEQTLTHQGKNHLEVAFDAGLNRIGFPTSALTGDLLPYLDPASSTYGRSPFVLPMSAALSGDPGITTFPLVAFHAPYGKDNEAGLRIRVDSLKQLLDADAGDKKRFGDHDDAIIIGDLNLDLNAGARTNMGRASKQAYDDLAHAGFEAAIPKVASSLKTVFNTKKKKKTDGIHKKYEDVAYQQLHGDVSNFTSSAYDNVLVRGAKLQSKVVTAAVVDVVGWIQDQIAGGAIDTSGAIMEWPAFAGLTAEQKAFFIYRTFVSDHLPVLIDIAVEPLKAGYDAVQENLRLYRKVMAARTRISVTEMRYDVCEYMENCSGATPLSLSSQGATLYVGPIVSLDAGHLALEVDSTRVSLKRGGQERGDLRPGALMAVVTIHGGPPQVHLAVSINGAADALTLVNGATKSVFVVGKVMKVSNDAKRVRLVVDRYRCVLPVLDTCSNPPVVGGYVMALLHGYSEKTIEVAV